MTSESIWLAIGFTGQFIFSSRFLVQWIHSESKRRSVIPISFWYLSLAGSVLLLSYSLVRRDPVFIFGQASGFIVYIRNLQLIWKQREEERAGQDAASPAPATATVSREKAA